MSNINDYLDYISTANYGSDVREAIVSSIRECYKDATGHPDSVAALVQEYIDREESIDDKVSLLTGLYNSLGEIVYSYDYNNGVSGIHIAEDEFGCVDQITLGPGKWIIKVISWFAIISNASPDIGIMYLSFSNTLDSDGFPIPLNDTYNYKDDSYSGTILNSSGSHTHFVKMIELTEERTIYMWIKHTGRLSSDIVVSPHMTAMKIGEATPSDGTSLVDQVVENTGDITVLEGKVATNISDISTLTSDVDALEEDVNDIKADLRANVFSALNNGYVLITDEWVKGNLNTNGEIDTSYSARLSCVPYLSYPKDVVLKLTNGYRYIVCLYDNNNTLISRTVLSAGTTSYTISANTIFRICIYNTSIDTITNIYDFASQCLAPANFLYNILTPANKGVSDINGLTSVLDIPLNEIYNLNRSAELNDMPRIGESGIVWKMSFQKTDTTATSQYLVWIGYSGVVATRVKDSNGWHGWHYHDSVASEMAAKLASEGKRYLDGGIWANATLNASGVVEIMNSRITTQELITPTKYERVTCNNGYLMILCTYNSYGTMLTRQVGIREFITTPNVPYRVTLYKEGDSSSILPEDISKMATNVYIVPIGSINSHGIQIFDNICGIGDSLMAGYTSMTVNNETYTISSADARTAKHNWLEYLGKRNGVTVYNEAVGGTTAHDWRYTYLANINPTNPNLFLIGLGVNDVRNETSVGSASDIKSNYNNNEDTFYGNLHYILSKIMADYPTARVIVFTIPRDGARDISAVNNAIRYVASVVNGCACVDLNIAFQTEITNALITKNFTNNHYNPRTYAYLSELIEQAVNQEIMNNPIFQGAPYWAYNINTLT